MKSSSTQLLTHPAYASEDYRLVTLQGQLVLARFLFGRRIKGPATLSATTNTRTKQ